MKCHCNGGLGTEAHTGQLVVTNVREQFQGEMEDKLIKFVTQKVCLFATVREINQQKVREYCQQYITQSNK